MDPARRIEPPPTVLLIEDDEVLAGLLIQHLVRRGHAAVHSGTAAAGIATLIAGLRPRLIVLDINLPDAAGWVVTRHPAYADAGRPAVLVTSAVVIPAATLAREGITGYLPKPFPLTTFMDVVERHLRPAEAAAGIEERP